MKLIQLILQNLLNIFRNKLEIVLSNIKETNSTTISPANVAATAATVTTTTTISTLVVVNGVI